MLTYKKCVKDIFYTILYSYTTRFFKFCIDEPPKGSKKMSPKPRVNTVTINAKTRKMQKHTMFNATWGNRNPVLFYMISIKEKNENRMKYFC